VVSSTLRPHFTPGKDPVLILQEAGWAPGPVWTGGKSRPHRDSIPDRPALSQSLYRLSCRTHKLHVLSGTVHNAEGRSQPPALCNSCRNFLQAAAPITSQFIQKQTKFLYYIVSYSLLNIDRVISKVELRKGREVESSVD